MSQPAAPRASILSTWLLGGCLRFELD